MIGHLVGCYGAMDRYLGMTASVLGEWERAEEHFRAALALNTRLGARTWLAHTAYWYARMLLARGEPDDADLVQAHLALALRLGREIGLPGLVRRVAELGAAEHGRGAATGRPHEPRGRDPRRARPRALEPRDRPAPPHLGAHGRQPHPLDPAQDELREPHRGGRLCHASGPRPGLTSRYHRPMPLYVIERRFAEQLELASDDVRMIDAINADEGVSWLFSFISADKLRTYCLYEAPSPDAIVEAARRANVPADEIVEVSKFVPAESSIGS